MKVLDPWSCIISKVLSHGEFVTLLALERLGRKRIESTYGYRFPVPVTRLAKEAGVSPVTAKRHLRRLKQLEFIDVLFNGCGVTTMVQLLDHPFKSLGEAA
jgi:DNA-binding MarR family transcriptional regulator